MMIRFGALPLLSLAFLAAALPESAAAQRARGRAAAERITYCCTGDNGKQLCSDVLPQECYNRAYREVNARGITVKQIPAPPTPEERAARAAEEQRAREAEVKKREQDRKDRALLDTYSNAQEIDSTRDRAIAGVQKNMKMAQDKQLELSKREKELETEAAPYKGKPMPNDLEARIRTNQAQLKAEQTTLEHGQKDIEALKARYGEEKRRYQELTTAPSGNAAAPLPPR